ncbi:MAG: hypothetical protein GY932_15555 [Arcobacter sp.]|nr:hypothetical protein [Arcobacter sp.]
MMQILIITVVSIALIAFIIYKVNDKFETKEISILLLLVLTIGLTIIYFSNKDEKVLPELFKEKYQSSKNAEITKLSSERLNNKVTSSDTNFIFKFDYIIKRDGKEFICTANNIKIKKIENEFVFDNFYNFKETCKKK